MISYRDPMVNYYVQDPERVAAFYREHFGFEETFRTPDAGPAVHIEVTLGTFVVGFALQDTLGNLAERVLVAFSVTRWCSRLGG